MTKHILYTARAVRGGHWFEATDIMPSLARARLFHELEAFTGSSETANDIADRAEITEHRARTFRRGDT